MNNEQICRHEETEQLTDINQILPVDYTFNLSDFALFLSVMKNKRAYQCTLSIILEKPQLELKEVKAEEVILNKSGKRAIRLDAWALDTENRQYNMEMQNDSTQDNIPKRSRFYQSLLDTPILKSGKKTRYRQLPSTVIIFITQEDIFKKEHAKYTFVERCEEVPELYLEDGTKKIFLNMSSRNGTPELISLLQYMKETHIDNPNIMLMDDRIIELDNIVQEVKDSDEWEAVKMNILEIGIRKGEEIGEVRGEARGEVRGKIIENIETIRKKLAKGILVDSIADMLELEENYVQNILNLIIKHKDLPDSEIADLYIKQIK